MLERNADAAHRGIAAAVHPGGAFIAGKDHLARGKTRTRRSAAASVWCGGDRVLRAILEAEQSAWRFTACRAGGKSGLPPANLRHSIRNAGELANGVERNLRIIGASLHGKIAARVLGHELVAVEGRHVDKR